MAATATAPSRRKPARPASSRRRAAAVPRRPVAVPHRASAPRSGLALAAVGTVTTVADSGLVLRLTRSRVWIGLLASLLVGIVALNVMALSLNAASSKTAGQSDELREQNSALRADIADGLSNVRLQSVAERIGLVMPLAASALAVNPSAGDAEVAARRLKRGDFEIGSTYVVPAPEAPVAPVVDPATGTVPASGTTAVAGAEAVAETPVEPVVDPAATATATTPVTPEAGGGVTP
jgi:hypothetical protein